MAKDTNFSSVVLLMHMDGADNGTTFTDVKGKTVSVFGNTATKTAVKKFGTASAYFDGAGDYLEIADAADWSIGSGDFTVEAWIYPTFVNTTKYIARHVHTSGYSGGGWWFGVNQNGYLFYGFGSGVENTTVSSGASVQPSAWQHVAATKSGTLVSVFLNGSLVGSGTFAGTPVKGDSVLNIGRDISANPTRDFNGYIDDLRITKGVARYTANFTPPTEPFLNGAYEVGGTVVDINGNPVARNFRAYRRDTGALLGTGVSSAATGMYNITVDHAGEVQVVMLDDAGGSIENDQILRTTPV